MVLRFRERLDPLLWAQSLGTIVDGHLAGLHRQHLHRDDNNLALLGELPDLARKLLGLSCDFWCKPGSLIRGRAAFSKSLAKPLISQLANCALSQSSSKAGPLDMAKLEKSAGNLCFFWGATNPCHWHQAGAGNYLGANFGWQTKALAPPGRALNLRAWSEILCWLRNVRARPGSY